MKNVRYLSDQIKADLSRKMLLLAGPRQVGKTTLSKSVAPDFMYLNYDIAKDRSRILKQRFDDKPLWIFDELHKFKRWKNYLKGIYDEHHPRHQILVTGSARLDLFRKAGDSLQGRYHFLRLLPFSAKEIKANNRQDLETLYQLSGFPEPLFEASKSAADRWSAEYQARLVRDEIREMERVIDIGALELLNTRLPECVGTPLSINSLMKHVQYLQDTQGKKIELSYFRTTDGKEVDFVILEKGNPVLAVECNLNDDEIGAGLKLLKSRFPKLECTQIHLNGKKDYLSKEGIRVSHALPFLLSLSC